jgi:hypothetical protein
MSLDDYADDWDDDTETCDACGEECLGDWECGFCSATLCRNCATEYDGCCALCEDACDEEDDL